MLAPLPAPPPPREQTRLRRHTNQLRLALISPSRTQPRQNGLNIFRRPASRNLIQDAARSPLGHGVRERAPWLRNVVIQARLILRRAVTRRDDVAQRDGRIGHEDDSAL